MLATELDIKKKCYPSRKSVFIDGGRFFIRKGPGTDELNPEQYHKYLEQNE